MGKKEVIKIFEEKKVRTVWDDVEEKWYFSIVDVCGVLTESPNPRNYWKVLKHRLVKEGNETVTNCNQLKLRAEDGKMRLAEASATEISKTAGTGTCATGTCHLFHSGTCHLFHFYFVIFQIFSRKS